MEIRLPQLGEGADSGTVVNVLVKPGDRVQADQPLVELETEKAVGTIPSPAAGTVAKIHVKEGDKLTVGGLIISLTTEDQAATPAAKAAPAAPAAAPPEHKAAAQSRPSEAPGPESPPAPAPARAIPGFAPPAAPSVRKLAAEMGIDLNRVQGSEPGGRIVVADLRAYVQRLQELAFRAAPAPAPAEAPAAEAVDFSQWGPILKKPLSSIRRTISRRMHEAWTAIPHVTQFDEADITTLMGLRKQFAAAYEAKGAHLTLTVFALRAVVGALKQHPIFNASLDEAAQELVLKQYYHLGVAVDTEHGLIVPVLRNVETKTTLELAKELEQLAEKTRQRKIAADELKGGTFTISNQGGIGGGPFTPIINRPEVAVLGLGRAALKPVVRNRQIEQRLMLPLCVSYDHRVIDGADAARFIVDLAKAFEEFPEDAVRI